MAVVIAALLPVFILIVLGVVLRRSLMRLDTQWHGLERLTYFVLFPDAADPDAGEGRPFQGAGRRRRRRALAVGAGDVAAVPRAAPGPVAARY
ncbi:hypothetical protein ABIA29_003180 [Bradyrhizobium japonicum]